MDHQYRENGARNVCSDYNQVRGYVEYSPNQSKKNFTLSTFPSNNQRNFEGSGKVLAVSVSGFHKTTDVQLYQPTLIRWYHLLYVYRQLFLISESLCISVRCQGYFVARFCQPSRNVFENRMTSFQLLLTPVLDQKLSVHMI